MYKFRCVASMMVISLMATLNSETYAYLGGFEQDDGYVGVFYNYPNFDVATYNAGQFGPNAGGGPYAPSTLGLWNKLQGPLVPASGAGSIVYASAHAGYDRTNYGSSDQALIITTHSDGWNGPTQEYSYILDAQDLNGVSPYATAGNKTTISFWSCAQLWGSGEGGGLGAGTIGDTVSFLDSVGRFGLAVGYEQPGTTTDFAVFDVGNGWVSSGIAIDPSTYHRWDIELDLANKKASISLFEPSHSANPVSLATNVPINPQMSNLTELRFVSTPGVNNAKLWSLDDFVFQVPEPQMGLLPLVAILAALAKRRNAVAV